MNRDDLQLLHRLQAIDSAIDRNMQLLATADDGTAAKKKLEEEKARLEELQEKLREKQAHQRKLALDLEGIEAEQQEKSDRAYGGTVSDPKELSALEKKIAELGRNAERHEDMILELLEEIDEVGRQVEEQQKTVDQLSREHERIVAEYEAGTSEAREEIEQLRQRREELVGEIDRSLCSQYEQLRERLDGVAVATLVDGTCQVCHVAVPRARWSMIKRGEGVIKCENCRRILVAPDEE